MVLLSFFKWVDELGVFFGFVLIVVVGGLVSGLVVGMVLKFSG